MSLDAAQELVADHRDLDRLMGEGERALTAGDAAAALERLDLLWARLAVHIRAEHKVLFDVISDAVRLSGGDPGPEEVDATIVRLRDDHDLFMRELAEAVNALKAAQAGESAELDPAVVEKVQGHLDAVRERMPTHNELEEERVYRWLGTLLPLDEQDRARERMVAELRDLPPRFDRAEEA